MFNISESFLTIYNQFHLIAWVVFLYIYLVVVVCCYAVAVVAPVLLNSYSK